MHKSKMLSIALLFCFAELSCYSQDPPIQAKITPSLTEVRNNETFSVSVVILNTDREEQVLQFSTCGEGIAWNTDNPLVHPHSGGYCKKPGLLHIRLKPGGVYTGKFSAHIELADDKMLHESVTFRLALFYESLGVALKVVPIWSYAVTVTVTR
jgi:hypothetical protein